MTKRTSEVIAQEPFLQTLPMKDVETCQLTNFLRSIYLFQTDSTTTCQAFFLILGYKLVTDQTKWLSTASESPKAPFVAVNHSSKVRVGETASSFLRRSLGVFRLRINSDRSRRLTMIVKLGFVLVLSCFVG